MREGRGLRENEWRRRYLVHLQSPSSVRTGVRVRGLRQRFVPHRDERVGRGDHNSVGAILAWVEFGCSWIEIVGPPEEEEVTLLHVSVAVSQGSSSTIIIQTLPSDILYKRYIWRLNQSCPTYYV